MAELLERAARGPVIGAEGMPAGSRYTADMSKPDALRIDAGLRSASRKLAGRP
jgi:hypothetical protein